MEFDDVTLSRTHVVRTKDIFNDEVKNNQYESLGKIRDIVLDKVSGQARYAILSYDGYLGHDEKLYALPWRAFHYDAEEECYILNVDKAKLKNAAGFYEKDWPNMADREWEEGIYTYYGIKPYWK